MLFTDGLSLTKGVILTVREIVFELFDWGVQGGWFMLVLVLYIVGNDPK